MVRHLFCLLTLLVLTIPSTWAQTQLSPTLGSLGTTVTISGSGFGEKRGKVTMTQALAAKGKKVKVWRPKIVSYADAEIVIKVTDGVLGDYSVTVTPAGKGAVPETAVDTFSLVLPSFPETPTTDLVAGGRLTVVGAYFGTSKGTLTIGGKRAKILTWTDTSLSLQMPAGLPNGIYDLIVRNQLGSSTLPAAVRITNSSTGIGGTDGLAGKFGKDTFTAAKDKLHGHATASGDGLTQVTVQGFNRSGSREVLLSGLMDLLSLPNTLTHEDSDLVLTFNKLAHSSEDHAKGGSEDGDDSYTTNAPGGSLSVRLFHYGADQRLSGDFTATLIKVGDDDKSLIASGSFTVTLTAPPPPVE